MFSGAHVVLYSQDAEADRAFFRDVLNFPAVDAGHGWLIFAMPPAEAAFHPADKRQSLGAALYLMCDDVKATIEALKAKNVACTKIEKERWGFLTTVPLPSGGKIGLYQPTHPTALKG